MTVSIWNNDMLLYTDISRGIERTIHTNTYLLFIPYTSFTVQSSCFFLLGCAETSAQSSPNAATHPRRQTCPYPTTAAAHQALD
jgi:hypothetical protein